MNKKDKEEILKKIKAITTLYSDKEILSDTDISYIIGRIYEIKSIINITEED